MRAAAMVLRTSAQHCFVYCVPVSLTGNDPPAKRCPLRLSSGFAGTGHANPVRG